MKPYSLILILSLALGLLAPANTPAAPPPAGFSFALNADMRYFTGPGTYDTLQYYRGAIAALAALGGSAFLISPGDIDPPANARWTIDQVLGASFRWVPVVGNHELPGAGSESSSGANMAWLRAYPRGTVNPGPAGCPETTFSFDYANAHFAVLNEYCDSGGDTVTAGDIPDTLYNWLAADLAASAQEHLFVVGHAPAFPQPDQENGRLRHADDSLNRYPQNRDRFWALLQARHVRAYFCGHTHNASTVLIGGVWQVDVGHARGLGDTGAPSTFMRVYVDGPRVTLQVYRDDSLGGVYSPHWRVLLAGSHIYNLPLVAVNRN